MHPRRGEPGDEANYITPQKLLDALTFLEANNPDIDVNTEWLETAMVNVAELCECLVEQHNDCDEQPIVDSDNSVDSPNSNA